MKFPTPATMTVFAASLVIVCFW